MDAYIAEYPDAKNVVIVLQFAKFAYYNKATWVSNNFTVTKLFIDEVIEAITVFKQRWIENRVGLSSSYQRSISSAVRSSVREDFLIKTKFNCIAEIEIKEPKSIIILATINYVPQLQEWYYLACNRCTKGVKHKIVNVKDIVLDSLEADKNQTYMCTNVSCLDKEITTVPRFRIKIRVQDTTGTVSLTLWDREAENVLKVSAEDLVQRNKSGVDTEVFPSVLNTLLDKYYAFKIDIKEYNVLTNSMSFNIAKLSDDEFIIENLEKKLNIQQNDLSDSLQLSTGNNPSQDMVIDKDLISFSGENTTTPLSMGESSIGNTKVCQAGKSTLETPCSNLKRNIFEIYDNEEDAPANSAIKGKATDVPGDVQEMKTKLLIPKKEK